MAYYCYMLLCANGAYYTGWTTDPIRRLKQHNSGHGARYTRMNGPCELVYVEEMPDHLSALKREIEIKKYRPIKKKALAENSSLNILSSITQEL
jgi:putative endonuclease